MHPVDDTISDRVLGHGDGLIVAFPIQTAEDIRVGGKDIATVKAFFFKIAKTQELNWRYTQLGAINAGAASALDYNWLGDTGHGTGSDVLRIVNDDFKLYHFGVGLNSPYLRVYEDIDPSNPNRAFDHSNSGQPSPTSLHNFGFYDGRMQADRFDPPVHTERVAFRNDRDGQFLQFGFGVDANDPNVADGNTDLELRGRTYQLRPVEDQAEQEFMLRQSRLRGAGRDIDLKVITVQVGGIFTYEIGTTLPDGWEDLEGSISQKLDYASGGQAAVQPQRQRRQQSAQQRQRQPQRSPNRSQRDGPR